MKGKCKINDYLIDFTCIYKITKISRDNNHNRLIHYRPVKGTDRVFTCRIPEKNLLKAGIRHILTKSETKNILNKFKGLSVDSPFNPRQFKEDLYINVVEDLINDLKCFYLQKSPLLKSEEELKKRILNHFCLEISFITGKENLSIKKTIESNILGK